MKSIIFIAGLILSLSACDNTKLQLRAADSEANTATATDEIVKSDSGATNPIKKDTVISH